MFVPFIRHGLKCCRRGLHFQCTIKQDIAVVKFDTPNSKVNSVSKESQVELLETFNKVSSDDKVKGIVLISGKPDCFVAGADIKMFLACKTASDAEELSRNAKEHLLEMENLNKPVVAAIMGTCMGLGLELALACHYKIAMNTPKTVLSAPEVMLGILPGAGGTQRIHKQVNDYTEALQIIMTGKNVRADKAKKLGLVQQLIQPLGPGIMPKDQNSLSYLEEIAVQKALELSQMKDWKSLAKPKKSFLHKTIDFLLQYDFVRDKFFDRVKAQTLKLTGGNYPAPLKIMEIAKKSLRKDCYEAESKGFGELAISNESKALMGLFFGQTACKKNKFGTPKNPVKTLGILGAGLMGAGIAQVSIEKSIPTLLKDISFNALARGENQISTNLAKSVKRRKLTQFDADALLSNLKSCLTYESFKDVDMVVEAVLEDLAVKHKVMKEIEGVMKPGAVFASNTSALPISKIAQASKAPENVIGMHYFSPVEKMQLLEVIVTPKTSQETKAKAVELGLRQGKLIIIVGDGPGFYTTRILAPMLSEALLLFQEGVTPKQVDKATKAFGWPVGLATLADEVGLDVAAHICDDLSAVLGNSMKGGNPKILKDLVAAGFHGRKSKKGLFLYDSGSKDRSENQDALKIVESFKLEAKQQNSDKIIQHRLFSRFVNEAILCLQEGILQTPLEGDIGAVFGLGFPPFLGGPFRYLDMHGASGLVKQMEEFSALYGPQFTPCQLLQDHAKMPTKKFHTSAS